MIDFNTLEKELIKCTEKLLLEADYLGFADYIRQLRNQGHRVLFYLNPDTKEGKALAKQNTLKTDGLLTKKENLIKLVQAEKLAAVRFQLFDYAFSLRHFENKLQTISHSEAIRLLPTIIDPEVKISIAKHLNELCIVVKSDLCLFKCLKNEL